MTECFYGSSLWTIVKSKFVFEDSRLSNVRANTIVMYPNPGFNTFNMDQFFTSYKTTPNEGRLVISLKTIKYFGLYCKTTVGFNYDKAPVYFQ